ncbi:MAG TPA: GldG family protein [Thermoanaerobaculia bacterium]|nr:GldG family protein [Thermoanaerobaculia bacterium]
MKENLKKKLVEGGLLSAGVLLALALLVIVNYFGYKYHQRFDWTKTRLYSLSDQTKNILKGLDRDIEIVVFESPQSQLAEPVAEITARYAAASPRISVRKLDPAKNLIEAERLLERYDTRYQEGSLKLVIGAGEDRRIFEEYDLADLDFSAMQMGGAARIASFKGEQVITGAIADLASGEKLEVRFTTGHGEASPDAGSGRGLSVLKQVIGGENLVLEGWSSLGQPAVPAGTDLLVVAAPITPFAPPELEAFSRYLAGGGRMLLLLDPALTPSGAFTDLGLSAWLAAQGVVLGEDVVVDPEHAVPFFGAQTFSVSSYGSHASVKALGEGRLNTLFELARSVAKGTAPAGTDVTMLAETSSSAWGETDLTRPSEVAKDAADVAGPVSLGVAVEKSATEEAGATGGFRLVVIGDSNFVTDQGISQAGNSILASNLFNWLLARESQLGIPPKKTEQVRMEVTGRQLVTIYLLILALPVAAIAAGVWVFFKRRR